MAKSEMSPRRQVVIVGANTPPPEHLRKTGVGEFISGIRAHVGVVKDIALVTETDTTGETSHTALMKVPESLPLDLLDPIFEAENSRPENVRSFILEHDPLPLAADLFDRGATASGRVQDGD